MAKCRLMIILFQFYILYFFIVNCSASYHEQYRVPSSCSENWESYIFNDREYIVQNLPVTWENAKILCRGHHNATLVILDTRSKAEFLAETLSESQFSLDSVWVGARRESAEDPAGYRWSTDLELRRTSFDVLVNEQDEYYSAKYPMWLNRTHIPVPDGGADCVALERVQHDKPVFLDLFCGLERPFVCEKAATKRVVVKELRTVRCKAGLYHVFGGPLDWHQAAAHCVMNKMSLANIGTMQCLKKLGTSMLKSRPSIENAWIGARGSLGKWNWIDTGASLFQVPNLSDVVATDWPPMRDRSNIKQSGCLQLDRHATKPPVFLEARCERKMHFICYEGTNENRLLRSLTQQLTSDDKYYYILVRQKLYWQHAFDNCQRLNGSLAYTENPDILVQLLIVMGENKDEPINHIWVSGRLNMSRDINTDTVNYSWHNPSNRKRIPDPRSFGEKALGVYMPPWLDEEYSTDSPCLNLDRTEHFNALLYGLPCDTPQYSICMIEKATKQIESTTYIYENTHIYETTEAYREILN